MFRLSVRAGLLLSFAVISLLVIIASGTGLVSLRAIDAQQRVVIDEAVPSVLLAEKLIESATELSQIRDALAKASEVDQALSLTSDILPAVERTEARLAAFADLGGSEAALKDAREVVTSLRSELNNFGGATNDRLRLKDERYAKAGEINAAASNLLDLTESLASNAKSRVSNVLSTLYDIVEDPSQVDKVYDTLDGVLDVDLFNAEQMTALKIDSLLLVGLVNDILESDDTGELSQVEERIAATLTALGRSISGIVDPDRKAAASAIFEEIKTGLDPENAEGLLRLRHASFANGATLEAIAARINGAELKLAEVVQTIGAAENRKIEAARAEMAVTSAKAESAMIALAIGAIVISLAIALLYVRRAIVGRLTLLSVATRKLAEGDLKAELPPESGDEIGQIAAALQVFKSNAEAASRMEAEQAKLKEKAEADAAAHQKEREEALGGEIVDLVQMVISGDLSHRLDPSDKTGVFATVCKQINELVVGLEAVLADVGGKMQALSNGDLTQRVDGDYQGAFGDLKDSTNSTAERLSEIVGEIQEASIEVNNAAAEIASGSTDLSSRIEQAAASIERAATSMEDMSTTVKENAENAKTASNLADVADKSAKAGGDVAAQAVTAMNNIENSAKRITEIIGVIDEIAFQTNLLALNASVEAARAGESGKGFAVVAQEVRSLAQRSAEAANDIKSLIQESNGQVEDGVQLVNRAGDALHEIVGSVSEVTGIVEGIATASEAQASGIEQINGTVSEMDNMTQQNSALVEETSASTHALSDQARKLHGLVGYFKLEGGRGSDQGQAAA